MNGFSSWIGTELLDYILCSVLVCIFLTLCLIAYYRFCRTDLSISYWNFYRTISFGFFIVSTVADFSWLTSSAASFIVLFKAFVSLRFCLRCSITSYRRNISSYILAFAVSLSSSGEVLAIFTDGNICWIKAWRFF